MAYANNGGASPQSNGGYSSYWTASLAQGQSFDEQNERIESLHKSIREQSILLSVFDTDDSTANVEELKRKIRNVSHELKGTNQQPAWTRYELNMRRLQDLTDEGNALKKEVDYLINVGVKNIQTELDPDHPEVQHIVNDIDKLQQDAQDTLKFDLPMMDSYIDMNRKQNRDRQMFEKGLFVSDQVARFIDQLEHEPRFATSPLSYDKPRSAPSIVRHDEDYLTYDPSPPPVPTTQRPGSPRSASDIKAEAQRRIEQRRLLFVNKYPRQQRSSENLRRKSDDASEDEKAAQERLRKAEAEARERLQSVHEQRTKARQEAEEKRKQADAQREAEQREKERLRQLQEEQERKEQEKLAEHRRKVEAEAMERRRKEIEEQERREKELALKREEEEKAAAEVRQRKIRQAAERAAREKRLRQEELERKEREREAARLEAEKRRREWLEAEEKRRQEKEAARQKQEEEERREKEEEERREKEEEQRKQEELDAQRRKEEHEKAMAEAEAAAAVEAEAAQNIHDLVQSDIKAPATEQNSTAGTSGYGVDIEDEVDFSTIYRVKSLYEYHGARNDDLSFGEDEIIKAHPHKDSASDWWYGTSLITKQVGFFPRTYVEIIEKAFRVRALYDFAKTRDDDLAFVGNEIIVVQPFQDDNSDWWYGTSEESNLPGYFPKSYVEVINPGAPSIQLPDTTPTNSTTNAQRETAQAEPHRGMSAPSTPILKKETLTVSRTATGRRRRAASNAGMLGNTEVPIGRVRAMSVPGSRPSSPALLTWASTMDQHELDVIPPEERKRQEAIFELISTEKTYLRDLQLIINVFYAESTKYLTRDEQDVVFSNIDDLLLCNTALLSDLESRQVDGVGVVSSIGDVFLKHAENLTCYSTYCRNQSFASRFLQDKRKQDQWFDVFLKTAQSRPECRALDLSHFLLEPMQRITRYPLLLQNILQATPKKHPDYGVLRSAHAKASNILQNVNEETRRYENSQKMRELSRLLDMGDYGRLDLSSREFVMEGVLYKAKSGRKLHAYLFNDILILAEPLKGLSPEGYLYRLYKEPMDIDMVTVRQHQHNLSIKAPFSTSASSSTSDDAGFQIVYGSHVIAVKASSASQKRQWINQIQHYCALQSTMRRQQSAFF